MMDFMRVTRDSHERTGPGSTLRRPVVREDGVCSSATEECERDEVHESESFGRPGRPL